MVIAMEEFGKPAVSTLEEVKKLQDLVRKLEIQNQQLRNKQNRSSKKSSLSESKDGIKSPPFSKVAVPERIEKTPVISNNFNSDISISTPEGNEGLNYLDEIDIIKVSDGDNSDDDSWLYTSPKGLTPEQKLESPYQWLRKDVDNPKNKELQLAKNALIKKLNELEILSPTSQIHQPQRYGNPTRSALRKPFVPYKVTSTSEEYHQNSIFDTRTFTKSKKKQALEYLASSILVDVTSETRVECQLRRRGSDISLDSLSSVYTMTDANDVQEVARMQEESLRMSSPVGTPKRHSVASNHSSRRLSVSSRSSISDIDNAEHSASNSQTVEETASPTMPSVEIFHHSDQSSPSMSPYGSNASLNNVANENDDTYRRSLPNLNRGSGGKPKSLKTPVSGERRQQRGFASRAAASGRRSDSNLHTATITKSRKEAMSPVRQKLRQPSSFVSPTASQSPLQQSKGREITPPTSRPSNEPASRLPAKSGLPKPTRSTPKLWSGIPTSSVPGRKNAVEDSWSEGCF